MIAFIGTEGTTYLDPAAGRRFDGAQPATPAVGFPDLDVDCSSLT